MVNDITTKSTGILIDERITAGFKQAVRPSTEIDERIEALDNVIEHRVHGRWPIINKLVLELERQLKLCWDAQETVMSTHIHDEYRWEERFDVLKLAQAGKIAQQTNAARNKLIREIDIALGELSHSTLEKTYG